MTTDALSLPAAKRKIGLPKGFSAGVATLVLLLLWEGAVVLFDVPAYILPAPSTVAVRVLEDFSTGIILPHIWVTFVEIMAGFLIAAALGVGLGTAVALVPVIDRTIYPVLLGLQTVPKVAVAPLLIIWFGYGIHSKAIMAALIAFFPILVNVIAGLKTTDARRILLMKALRAGPVTTYFKVRLPSMLPYLFAGLEVGIIFSVIGAIVGEFVGSSVGLGSLIIQRQGVVDVVGVFSVLAYLSVMGLMLSLIVKLVSHRMTFWSRSQELAGG